MELTRKVTYQGDWALEVSEVIALATEVEALSKKIDSLSHPKSMIVMACERCGEKHMAIDCPIVGAMHGPTELVDFVGSGP